MEYSLRHFEDGLFGTGFFVLILILMEYSLRHDAIYDALSMNWS